MSTGTSKRHRSSLVLPPGQIARTVAYLRRTDVLTRLGLCLLAALLMWIVTSGWAPPFAFRTGDLPPRDIVARTEFSLEDPAATDVLKDEIRESVVNIYSHDVQHILDVQKELKDRVFQIIRAESYEKLDKELWRKFSPSVGQPDTEGDEAKSDLTKFERFKKAFEADPDLQTFEQIVKRAFTDFEEHGLIYESKLKTHGNRLTIRVHSVGDDATDLKEFEVKDVRIKDASETLRQRLAQEFETALVAEEPTEVVTERILSWLNDRGLPETLVFDQEATDAAIAADIDKVEIVMKTYKPGDRLVEGNHRLTSIEIDRLQIEHNQLKSNMAVTDWLGHFLADLGMYCALYILCGFFIFYRDPDLLENTARLATLLGTIVITVAICRLVSFDRRAELVPLVLFAMTAAIAYRHELALLFSASVSLIVTLSLGQGLVEFVIYVATAASAIQLLDRVRSRTKLIYVGLGAGVVAALTTAGVSTVASRAFGSTLVLSFGDSSQSIFDTSAWSLVNMSLWSGICAILGGVIMTGMLPFIEKLFDVQTDISLLELGDARHPLLQELVRRAPGTYNHSINVASIGEAAADSIGANGLLVRVGAYFHDIGKMLKPSYFIENQDVGVNRHESLVPAMSTLVIIAHVKDGADLARQHHLPQTIIDFIEQHHGTTLVEYFYNEATKKQEADPDGGEVEEANFRYPGPRPQTKESGVMMLADATESASRALVEPTPSRIENLVHDIVLKKLRDGQFDECGLTMKEIATIEDSLVKSLTAVYHGRVKYPDKQHTA